jgi:hypothetical protein
VRFDFFAERDGRSYGYLAPVSLPMLVLAIREHAGYPHDWNFREPERWSRVVHQTAGHACHQHYMWAMELEPNRAARTLMAELNHDVRLENLGLFGVPLDEVLYYRGRIQEFGLDCNGSYPDLEEAIYPIDCSVEVVRQVSDTPVPDDLDELIAWRDNRERLPGSIGRWRLYILTQNSD